MDESPISRLDVLNAVLGLYKSCVNLLRLELCDHVKEMCSNI